ncbi:hypothetical protein HNY73_011277 [Argiope bruennichi]|uniref:Uncharacterized protein n=1 Tax=Argiope bruennichi TaxID=94029 RepID=A0A8T0F5T5_ARGBR|nr:hypothetical protein HNY73_011277 [Argiope bruennichi]
MALVPFGAVAMNNNHNYSDSDSDSGTERRRKNFKNLNQAAQNKIFQDLISMIRFFIRHKDYFGLDDRDLNIPIEHASIEMPTQIPNDAQLIDAIKDWLKSPNFDFIQNLEPNPPDLPLDLYDDLFDY